MGFTAARRPLIRTSVSRFRSWAWLPPAVFWLVFVALLLPVLLRPANDGICFRTSSSALFETPPLAMDSLLITLTGTATWSGEARSAVPVMTISPAALVLLALLGPAGPGAP